MSLSHGTRHAARILATTLSAAGPPRGGNVTYIQDASDNSNGNKLTTIDSGHLPGSAAVTNVHKTGVTKMALGGITKMLGAGVS